MRSCPRRSLKCIGSVVHPSLVQQDPALGMLKGSRPSRNDFFSLANRDKAQQIGRVSILEPNALYELTYNRTNNRWSWLIFVLLKLTSKSIILWHQREQTKPSFNILPALQSGSTNINPTSSLLFLTRNALVCHRQSRMIGIGGWPYSHFFVIIVTWEGIYGVLKHTLHRRFGDFFISRVDNHHVLSGPNKRARFIQPWF